MEIVKPSEHGLGIVYVPDKRTRYKPVDCKDQETDYPRWIVEAWERLLVDHFRNIEDPENAFVSRELWFDNLPAVMRVRVTTPNVLRALRRRDPGAAKPYNFALSPILLQPSPDCTLIAPASKHPEEWLTREYTEIHSGETVKLLGQYQGKVILPQTLSSVIWRHYLHPEDKSLSPDGKPCDAYTRGLLMRRPIQAMTPFIFIGKEIERRAQEGEDVSVLENPDPSSIRRPRCQTVLLTPGLSAEHDVIHFGSSESPVHLNIPLSVSFQTASTPPHVRGWNRRWRTERQRQRHPAPTDTPPALREHRWLNIGNSRTVVVTDWPSKSSKYRQ
jgi:hypothetical protein